MASESAARPQATPGAAALPPSPRIFSTTVHGFTFPGPRVPSNTGNALLSHNGEYHTISALAPTLEPVPSTFAPAHCSAPYRVPRPPNAFMLFRSWCCKENANGKTQPRSNLNDSIPAQWKALSPELREWWKARAKEKKKEHEARHPGYKYQPQRKVKNGTSAARRKSRAALQHDGGASLPRQASHLPNVAVLCTFDPPSAPTTSPLARSADDVPSPASNSSQVWASPSLPSPANNPAHMRPLSIPVYRPSEPHVSSPSSPSLGHVPFPGSMHTYPPSDRDAVLACPGCGLALEPPFASAATEGLEAGYPPAPLPPQPAQANFFDATSLAQYGLSTPTAMRPHHEVMQPTMPPSGIFSRGGDGPMHAYPPGAFPAASHAGAYYAHRGRGHALAGDLGANYPLTPPAHGWDRTRTGGPLLRAPQAPHFPGAASTSRAPQAG